MALQYSRPNRFNRQQRPTVMGSPGMVIEAVREIPEATSRDLTDAFDYTARHYLGLSGQEFLDRLDCDQLPKDGPKVKKVLRRIDLVRPGWRGE